MNLLFWIFFWFFAFIGFLTCAVWLLIGVLMFRLAQEEKARRQTTLQQDIDRFLARQRTQQ